MTDKADAVRALVESARAWRAEWRERGDYDDARGPKADALYEAIGEIERLFTVRYADVPHEMWMHVRERDLVKTPRGEWLEVVASVEGATPATQRVTFLMGGKHAGPYDRPAEARVDVRRPLDEMNAAIDLFADAFEIRAIEPEQYGS